MSLVLNQLEFQTKNLEGCLPINNLPCGTPCSNPCHPMCVNYPTGVSPRHQVIIDGELSCNSFGYCKDGDHVVEDCTPGQYFDGGPGKFTPKSPNLGLQSTKS